MLICTFEGNTDQNSNVKSQLKITYQLYGLSIRNPIRKVRIAEPLWKSSAAFLWKKKKKSRNLSDTVYIMMTRDGEHASGVPAKLVRDWESIESAFQNQQSCLQKAECGWTKMRNICIRATSTWDIPHSLAAISPHKDASLLTIHEPTRNLVGLYKRSLFKEKKTNQLVLQRRARSCIVKGPKLRRLLCWGSLQRTFAFLPWANDWVSACGAWSLRLVCVEEVFFTCMRDFF